MRKIRRQRAFPLNLETKEEQSNTASDSKALAKRQRKDETEEKKTRVQGREGKIQKHWLSDHLCLILYPNGTGLNQILIILDHALA